MASDVVEVRHTPAEPYSCDEERWAAVVRRDPNADGHFYYSVRTTGVYCRPSCGARLAQRKNVAFHASALEAERAGFRPCKRCRPDGPSLHAQYTELVAAACRQIECATEPPRLEALARAAGLSPHHFHRVFKQIVGVTPRAYANAVRRRRAHQELGRKNTVTEALYDAGFGSNGRFYAAAQSMLGMTPSQFRAGGEGRVIRFAIGQCSLGAILVAASEKGVCAISLGDDPEVLLRDLQDRFACAELVGGDAQFERLVAQVVGFVEAPVTGLDLPLDIRGTAFQQRVWEALRAIPPGVTVSYSELAHRLAMPGAARAVARACAANMLAVAIPCHRVVRSDGSLSGYRWGVERKRELLRRERGEG